MDVGPDDRAGRAGCHSARAAAIAAAEAAVADAEARITDAERRIAICEAAADILESLAERLARALGQLRTVPQDLGEVYALIYEFIRAGGKLPRYGRWIEGANALCARAGPSRPTSARPANRWTALCSVKRRLEEPVVACKPPESVKRLYCALVCRLRRPWGEDLC